VPATLQLNLYRSKTTVKPWAVFVAATGQFNYNFAATIFGEKNKDFVNRTGISTIYSIGYTSNKFSFSALYRMNMNELFISDNIYKFDNGNQHNDYSKLDKILGNKHLFGISISYIY